MEDKNQEEHDEESRMTSRLLTLVWKFLEVILINNHPAGPAPAPNNNSDDEERAADPKVVMFG
jgi:hypothetical protein